MGHQALFVGTKQGMEASLVPRAGYEIEWIEIGGLQRVGLAQTLKTLAQLPAGVLRSRRILRVRAAAAVFSMGGYVAAPVMQAASWMRIPMIVMEPNAMPGLVTRRMGQRVRHALLNFEEAGRYFPPGSWEITGLPVRQQFFEVPDKEPGKPFHVLITGGSRGSRALNRAARESWPLFRKGGLPVRLTLQSGTNEHGELARDFAEAGLDGEVKPFIEDMAAAYAAADLVISRSGAGAVSELAAAGKPSLLVPFPFAADDHQRMNAEAMQRLGAARVVLEADWDGKRMFEEVREFCLEPERLRSMSRAARSLGHPGAARRAAELLVEAGRGGPGGD